MSGKPHSGAKETPDGVGPAKPGSSGIQQAKSKSPPGEKKEYDRVILWRKDHKPFKKGNIESPLHEVLYHDVKDYIPEPYVTKKLTPEMRIIPYEIKFDGKLRGFYCFNKIERRMSTRDVARLQVAICNQIKKAVDEGMNDEEVFSHLVGKIYGRQFVNATYGDGLSYNWKHDDPVHASETSEAELDPGFYRKPQPATADETQRAELVKAAAKEKKARDVALIQDQRQAASVGASKADAKKSKAPAKPNQNLTVAQMQKQIREATRKKCPVQVTNTSNETIKELNVEKKKKAVQQTPVKIPLTPKKKGQSAAPVACTALVESATVPSTEAMRPVTAMNWTPSKKSGTSNCPRMSPRTTPRKSPRKPKPIMNPAVLRNLTNPSRASPQKRKATPSTSFAEETPSTSSAAEQRPTASTSRRVTRSRSRSTSLSPGLTSNPRGSPDADVDYNDPDFQLSPLSKRMKGNGKATPGVPVKNFGAKRVACPGSSVDQMKDLPVKKVSRPSPPPLDMEVDEEEPGEDTGEDEEDETGPSQKRKSYTPAQCKDKSTKGRAGRVLAKAKLARSSVGHKHAVDAAENARLRKMSLMDRANEIEIASVTEEEYQAMNVKDVVVNISKQFDNLKRVPPLMRSLIGRRKTAVEEQVENRQLMNDILTRMSGLEAECTALRQMYHVRRIKIHEYIPVEDMAGLAKCFDRQDPQYSDRLAAISEYLLRECDFKSVSYHAMSFSRALMTPDFRSLYMWDKSKVKNTREGQNYSGLQSLPAHVKTYINDELAKHIPYFGRPPHVGVKFDAANWLLAFKKTFSQAQYDLSSKSIVVHHAEDPFDWDDTAEYRESYRSDIGNVEDDPSQEWINKMNKSIMSSAGNPTMNRGTQTDGVGKDALRQLRWDKEHRDRNKATWDKRQWMIDNPEIVSSPEQDDNVNQLPMDTGGHWVLRSPTPWVPPEHSRGKKKPVARTFAQLHAEAALLKAKVAEDNRKQAAEMEAAKKDGNKKTETAGDLMNEDPAFQCAIAADIATSNNDERVLDPTTAPIEQDPLSEAPVKAGVTGDFPDLTQESLAQIPVLIAERLDEQKETSPKAAAAATPPAPAGANKLWDFEELDESDEQEETSPKAAAAGTPPAPAGAIKRVQFEEVDESDEQEETSPKAAAAPTPPPPAPAEPGKTLPFDIEEESDEMMSPTHSSNQSPDEVEDGTSVQQTDGAASTPIPEVETMFVPVKEITPSPTHSPNQSPDEVGDGTSGQQTDGAASTPIPEVETMFVPVKEITPSMSDSDHIIIEGEAVTLDPAQVDYCSSQDRQVTVVVENVPPDVAAEATKSAVEDPETTKEAPSSPVPLNVIITPDLRAQLLSPVTALSEGDLEVVTEGSEDMPGRSLSEF